MHSPSSVQIREANAHLAALHRRVVELEAELRAADCTAREQVTASTREITQLTETKEREITSLHKKLSESEETIQCHQQSLKQSELLVVQLQHRCDLLNRICESRPTLDRMLALMAEAERTAPDLGAAGPSSHLKEAPGAAEDTGAAAAGQEDTRGEERRTFPFCFESRCMSVLDEGTTGYSKVVLNHKDFCLSEDDVDTKDMEFGTTV
ncbi:hypothetical protein NHX12_032895 [Muraenolepis orangiensis]|uniref:Vimentin-type intermediate filament-associated coiled-coil protein n=1 Tax=Muraenolepis orangiensis TaxID=630683 RepID=A0A9Q0IFU9_9TELE|nr:hypothetical protein NHX12_032895 [Muraenolepis orangiensis]